MANAAELRLQVGLDLAFFRQQLAQLGNTAVGYSLPINIDRLGIQKEITKLGKNISSRKYTLKIETTIKTAVAEIVNLEKALESLEKKSINIKIAGTGNLTTKEARKIRTDLRESIISNGGKIKIPTTITAAITNEDIRNFKNAVKSKLEGVSVDVKINAKGRSFAETEHGYSGLTEFMRKQGLIGKTASGMTGQMGKGGDDIKQQLNDAVQSAQKIKSIFDGVAKSIAITGKSTAIIQGKRLGLTNVPLMTGGVERRIQRSSAAIGGTASADALKALYPEVSKTITSFAALKGQIQQNTSKLSGFSLILGLAAFAGVPLAKSVVKLTGSADNFAKLLDELGLKLETAFNKAVSNILSTASSRLLSGGNVAGLLPAAYRGIGPSAQPSGLLPPAYRGIGPSRNAGFLPPAYRGLPFGFDFRGLPPESGAPNKAGALGPTVQQMRQQRLSALRIQEAQVRDISGTFDIVGNFNSGQKAASQKRLNKAVADFVRGLEDITRRAILQGGIRQVDVQDLGRTINRQAILPGRTQGPLMLPAAGGTTPRNQMPLHAVSTGAYVGQPSFMRAPSVPPSIATGGGNQPPAPPTPPGGGRGGFGGFAGAAGIQLPGAGLVHEIGAQFGYAAQQVLLFGAAYKALAFLTDFPSKVGEAVAQLQSFNNTLKAITPSGDEFRASNQFILDTVDKYNVPLQSARDGFTNLYASMAPAGFKGDEIRNIFTGVSQAAATFGMSADKVDRVNYAFAQMASKGQVMSEELKGQLGDVLPGAVAIFAQAAGFTGPKAMVDFTKAMEDGRYKGEAMKQLLINVGIVMKDKFAKGAEGAAQSFQGQMNAMATATQKLHESFAPVANLFASNVIKPLTEGLKVATDGFKAYFEGQRAANPEAEKLNKILEVLMPSLSGIAKNVLFAVQQLTPFAQVVGFVVLQVSRLLALPFVRYLAATYLQVLLLSTAFNTLATAGVGAAISSFAQFTKGMILHAGVMMGMTKATQQSTFAMYQFGMTIQTVMIKSIIGIALVAIGALIARIADLKGQLASIGNDAKGMEEVAKSSAKMGDIQGTKEAFGNIENRLKTIKELRKELSKAERIKTDTAFSDRAAISNSFRLPIKDDTAKKLIELGYVSKKFLTKTADGYTILEHNLEEVNAKIAAGEEAFSNATQKKNILIDQSIRKNKELGKSILGAIPGVDGGEKAAKEAARRLKDQQNLADSLSSDQTKTEIERQVARFENEKNMINMAYDLREARANSFQKETIRFQKELFNIEMERQKAVLNANNAIVKAQGNVAGGTSGFIDKSVLQKWLESQGFGRTTGDFTNKGHATPNHMLNAMDMGIIGGSDADALRKTKAMEAKLRSTGAFGNQLFGPTSDPMGHGAGRGGGNIHLHIPTREGKVPMTPGLAALMNYSGDSGVTGTSGRISPRQRRVALANQQTANAIKTRSITLTLADVEATKKAEIATANYVASIMPVAEQQLQNTLLQRRLELMRTGITPEEIDTEMKIYEAQQKQTIGIKAAQDEISKVNELKAQGKISSDDAARAIENEQRVIDSLTNSLDPFTKAVQDAALASKDLAVRSALIDLGKRAEMARAFTPQAEMQVRIKQQYPNATESQLGELFKTEQAVTKAEELKTQMQGVASTIGDAFSTAFQGIINGSVSAQDALAGMFQSIGQSFVKMAMEMIAQQLTMITLGFIMKALGLAGAAAGAGSTPLPGSAPQMTPNAIVTPTGFEGMIPANFAAKGATFSNGIAKFATGGIVNGPTLFPFADGGAMQMGLMGEAGPEAIMPLQRGSDGSLGVRAAMGGNGMGGSSSPVLNMSFETSTINGVEYVSRDQLEAAMAQTRRQASSDGAKRGMAMTLDKIQQSPQTRRRIGM